MLRALLQASLNLISTSPCPVCGGGADPPDKPGPCLSCRETFELAPGGLTGDTPLPWLGLGPYEGAYRLLLLSQRQRPKGTVLRGLARALAAEVPGGIGGSILVAIPSWKRQGNPLPNLVVQQLIAQQGQGPPLGARALPLLQRSRPTLGQHHLDRQLRLRNQEGAFRLQPGQRAALPQLKRQPIWLVDDILTTGATALAAAAALEQAGLEVKGLLCLARTPFREPTPGRKRSRPEGEAVEAKGSPPEACAPMAPRGQGQEARAALTGLQRGREAGGGAGRQSVARTP
jgi:predicted amidophosphoribosyltransferase